MLDFAQRMPARSKRLSSLCGCRVGQTNLESWWVIVASRFMIHVRLELKIRWFVMTHHEKRELDPPYGR
jgi:hypothetical protein